MTSTRELSIKITHTGLPDSIHGFVSSTSPGKYHIFLNAAETDSQQAASFLHECLHIFHGDLERDDAAAGQIEAERHKELESILFELTQSER